MAENGASEVIAFTDVPLSALPHLRCSLCESYLSVFPIYISKTHGNICGRCSLADIQDTMRNEVYEGLAILLRFPCSYDLYGCLVKLPISTMNEHELICKDRRLKCPCIQSKCTWHGPIVDLAEHYEENHLVFLMKQPDFEVNFVNKFDETYLLLYEEEMFLFNRTSNNGILSWSVLYVGWSEQRDFFSYQIKLKNRVSNYEKVYPKAVTDGCEHNCTVKTIDELKNDLDNPSVVIGSVEITYTQPEKPTQSKEDNQPELFKKMLQVLECPVCFLYMVPPIYQCEKGHSICSTCKVNIRQCPTCRDSVNDKRNYTLEDITKIVVYPCKNSEVGCSYMTEGGSIRVHEKYCKFGSVECPSVAGDNCNYRGRFDMLYQHWLDVHPDDVLQIDEVHIPFDGGFEYRLECLMKKYLDKLFIIWFEMENDTFFWCIQLLGSPEEVADHKYELEILDNNNGGNRLYFRGDCSVENLRSEDSFLLELKLDQLNNFISDTFSFKIRILKKSLIVY